MIFISVTQVPSHFYSAIGEKFEKSYADPEFQKLGNRIRENYIARLIDGMRARKNRDDEIAERIGSAGPLWTGRGPNCEWKRRRFGRKRRD